MVGIIIPDIGLSSIQNSDYFSLSISTIGGEMHIITQSTARHNLVSRCLIWSRPVTRRLFKPLVVGMILVLGVANSHTATTVDTSSILTLIGLMCLVMGAKFLFLNKILNI